MSATRQGRPRRFNRWRNGWALALRMARRELGRDRLRAVGVWLMIALPVAAICGIQVVLASSDISRRERTELELAGSQAVLRLTESAFTPSFDGVGTVIGSGEEESRPPLPVPGWGASTVARQQAVGQLAGRPALALTMGDAVRTDGLLALVLGIDTTRPDAVEVVQLVDGRLPVAADEVLVTAAGLGSGLPASGTLTLRDDTDAPFRVTVVGTAATRLYTVPELITAPDPDPETVQSFLLTGDQPVTWQDAVRLAEYGFMTSSRHLLDHPPDVGWQPSDEDLARFFTTLLISSGALLEVMLVVGPAFAISAARQRRSLALAASNGAPPAQLRRAALGQSVLLGVSAATIGAAVGTAVGIGVWPLLSADPGQLFGPLEIPLPQLVITVGLGILAAVLAALIAARGLGRLDLVSALRGSLRSTRARRGAPVRGAALVAGGLALSWSIGWVLRVSPSLVFAIWCVGAVAVLVGVLLLVPAVLRTVSRLAARAPIAARLALRELTRQQGRATSAVAAIMAGGVVLSVVWTIVLTVDAEEARHYQAEIPPGHATVRHREPGQPERLLRAADIVRAVDPGLRTARTTTIDGWLPEGADEEQAQLLAAVNPGCDPTALLTGEPPAGCAGLGSGWGLHNRILTGPEADLIALFALDAAQQRALREGALLVDTSPPAHRETELQPASTTVVAGRVGFIRYDFGEPASIVTEQVAAHPVSSELIGRGASLDRVGGLISLDAALQRQWQPGGWELQVSSPHGPITPELEVRLAQALQLGGFSIDVERGWRPDPQPVVWSMTGAVGLLAVVAAVLTTVLGVGELKPFLATFAAVGADPRLSRRLASVQAWLTGFLGSVFGVVVGTVAAMPLMLGVTSREGRIAPVLVLPWQLMLALVTVIPVVAAVVAMLSVPGRPTLVRRLA